jgi:hypothetical protein
LVLVSHAVPVIILRVVVMVFMVSEALPLVVNLLQPVSDLVLQVG